MNKNKNTSSDITFKEAFMLLKAIEKTCKDIYDSKSNIIVKQLENTENKQYKSDYGLFSLKNNAEKTIKEYTPKEQIKFDQLQKQIDDLKAQQNLLGTEKIIKESYNTLVYRKNSNAETKAKELLSNLILAIGNITMIKASKK